MKTTSNLLKKKKLPYANPERELKDNLIWVSSRRGRESVTGVMTPGFDRLFREPRDRVSCRTISLPFRANDRRALAQTTAGPRGPRTGRLIRRLAHVRQTTLPSPGRFQHAPANVQSTGAIRFDTLVACTYQLLAAVNELDFTLVSPDSSF